MQNQVRLTVYLPEDVEHRLRLYAAYFNKSRSDVINECLQKLPEVTVSLPDEVSGKTLIKKV
jgi:hypothetical protein